MQNTVTAGQHEILRDIQVYLVMVDFELDPF